MTFGVSSMTGPLRRVAMRRPSDSLLNADPSEWHYGPGFDSDRIEAEHASLAGLLQEAGVEVQWMEGADQGIADAVFTYDASLVTPAGAILMAPGKRMRAGEQELHRAFYTDRQIPILGEITGEGSAEAGDTLWLDPRTLAAGRGFRTNRRGIDQLKSLLAPQGISVVEFDLPVYHGAEACLHLMSLASLVDTRTALVCKPLLPVGLWELMTGMGFSLLEAPCTEFEESGTLSANVLAVSPGHCIMIDGFSETRAVLEAAGVSVQVFCGEALCIGCEGGPTCLTRPLLREPESA